MNDNKNVEYFLAKITHYTKTHLKPIHEDDDFLHYRSRLATKAYEGCLAAGNPENLSFEIANDILLDGLRANEFVVLSDLLDREYQTYMQYANRHRLVVLLITCCEPVFNKYVDRQHGHFTEMAALEKELREILTIWFTENMSHPLLRAKKETRMLQPDFL